MVHCVFQNVNTCGNKNETYFSQNYLKHKIIGRVTNINHKGLQSSANEYAEERRIYKDMISKNNNVDILNSAHRSFIRRDKRITERKNSIP